ncbi:Serine/threonine protein kinase [Pelomyxa schiedti]|nr:Serine/threonine protein kinase [Pelomyxa schiedti]
MLVGYPPFASDSSEETCYKILNVAESLQFPDTPVVSEAAADLIRKLVCDQKVRLGVRGGIDEIKRHRFFEGIDWDNFREAHHPPIVPALKGVEDTSHFTNPDHGMDDPINLKEPPHESAPPSHDIAFIGYTFQGGMEEVLGISSRNPPKRSPFSALTLQQIFTT